MPRKSAEWRSRPAPGLGAPCAGDAADRQVRRVGMALSERFEEKSLSFGPLAGLRGRLLGATAAASTRRGSAALQPPWPDVLITSGQRSAPVARWVRGQSGGRTRLVQLGRPGGPFTLFDLIVAAPDDRLPIRSTSCRWQRPERGADVVAEAGSPVTAVMLASRLRPTVLDERSAAALGKAASAEVARLGAGSSSQPTPAPTGSWRHCAVPGHCPVELWIAPRTHAPAMFDRADRFIVTAGDGEISPSPRDRSSGRPVRPAALV